MIEGARLAKFSDLWPASKLFLPEPQSSPIGSAIRMVWLVEVPPPAATPQDIEYPRQKVYVRVGRSTSEDVGFGQVFRDKLQL